MILNFSHSFPVVEAVAHFHSSGPFGEKMEKSQSNESTSSSSSMSSSRSKQRLQAQIAAARPLKPKGGGDDHPMSRDNSSQSMIGVESKDGSQDKIAIAKPTYQRPKHDRVFCDQCDDHPDGFRGEHELRRHQARQHELMVKKWVCIQPEGLDHPEPVLSLAKCKACSHQQKKYGAYYNAAAHLRRAHFKPRAKGRTNKNKVDDAQKRGGKAGGDWPPMSELKHWMREVEEPATDYLRSAAQPQEADDSNDETLETSDEQVMSADKMNTIPGSSFDTPFGLSDTSFEDFLSHMINNEHFDSMHLDLSSHQANIDSSMNFPPVKVALTISLLPTRTTPSARSWNLLLFLFRILLMTSSVL